MNTLLLFCVCVFCFVLLLLLFWGVGEVGGVLVFVLVVFFSFLFVRVVFYSLFSSSFCLVCLFSVVC